MKSGDPARMLSRLGRRVGESFRVALELLVLKKYDRNNTYIIYKVVPPKFDMCVGF